VCWYLRGWACSWSALTATLKSVNNRDYYTNVRKAFTAGYFMQDRIGCKVGKGRKRGKQTGKPQGERKNCALKLSFICNVQVRVAAQLGLQLVSTDFNNRDYYTNIRKAITAGYFMQVCCSHVAWVVYRLM
jgi:hypothetical protein